MEEPFGGLARTKYTTLSFYEVDASIFPQSSVVESLLLLWSWNAPYARSIFQKYVWLMVGYRLKATTDIEIHH